MQHILVQLAGGRGRIRGRERDVAVYSVLQWDTSYSENGNKWPLYSTNFRRYSLGSPRSRAGESCEAHSPSPPISREG